MIYDNKNIVKIMCLIEDIALLEDHSLTKAKIMTILEHIPDNIPVEIVQVVQQVAYGELETVMQRMPELLNKKDQYDRLLADRKQITEWYVRDCIGGSTDADIEYAAFLEEAYFNNLVLLSLRKLQKKRDNPIESCMHDFIYSLIYIRNENDFSLLDDKEIFALLRESFEILIRNIIKIGCLGHMDSIDYPIEWILCKALWDDIVTNSCFFATRNIIDDCLEKLERHTEACSDDINLATMGILDYWERNYRFDTQDKDGHIKSSIILS